MKLDSRSPEKAPTCVLVEPVPPHKPLAFGIDALKQRGVKGLLFVEFKMKLRPGGLLVGRGNPNAFRVKDTGGSDWPLLVPVVATLAHVKNKVLAHLRQLLGPAKLATSEIRWVVTVPAIWDDEARAFMRYAAQQAGIVPTAGAPSADTAISRLILALEPESAAIAALPRIADLGHALEPDDTLLVVDSGGGTLDVSLVECIRYNHATRTVLLAELAVPGGGPHGGTAVDRGFTSLLARAAGRVEVPQRAWAGLMREDWLIAKARTSSSEDAFAHAHSHYVDAPTTCTRSLSPRMCRLSSTRVSPSQAPSPQ